MKQIILLIQLVSVALAETQQQTIDVLSRGSWPFYSAPVSNSNPAPFPTCLLWSRTVNRRDDYTFVPGIGSYKLHTRPVTWNEARKTCVEEGGHLAIINSVAEAEAIVEIFDNAKPIVGSHHAHYISIGFHDLFREGEFVTVHDQSLAMAGYTRWGAGQPDNEGGVGNCGCVHKSGDLHDANCGVRLGFICEHPFY